MLGLLVHAVSACSLSGSYYSISNFVPKDPNGTLNQTPDMKVVTLQSGVCHWEFSGEATCGGLNQSTFGSQQVLLGIGDFFTPSVASYPLAIPLRKDLSAIHLDGIREMVSGFNFSCALARGIGDSTSYCWGTDQFGNLGNDLVAATSYAQPVVQISLGNLARSVDIAAGKDHACSIQGKPNSMSEIFCWGRNNFGQAHPTETLPFTNQQRARLVDISALGPNLMPVQLALGASHSCVRVWSNYPTIPEDGKVICWGSTAQNTLGSGSPGTPDFVLSAAGVPLSGVVDIAAAQRTTCALTDQNKVFCWGDNSQYELGFVNNNPPGALLPLIETPLSLEGANATHSAARPSSIHSSHGSNGFCVKTSQWHLVTNEKLDDLQCWGREGTDETLYMTPNLPTFYLGGGFAAAPFVYRIGSTRVRNSAGERILPDVISSLSIGTLSGCFTTVQAGESLTQCWGSNENSALSNGIGFGPQPSMFATIESNPFTNVVNY